MGDWDHRGSRDVEAILGACMMVRRELAQAVGGLPDDVFMFHEDLAFCLRVRAEGYRIRYLGDVATMHHVGASRGRAVSRLNLLEGEVRVRLIRERGGPVRAAFARPAFAFRSLARLAGALVGGALPGMAALRAKRPKAFDVRVHALHLLWALAPTRGCSVPATGRRIRRGGGAAPSDPSAAGEGQTGVTKPRLLCGRPYATAGARRDGVCTHAPRGVRGARPLGRGSFGHL